MLFSVQLLCKSFNPFGAQNREHQKVIDDTAGIMGLSASTKRLHVTKFNFLFRNRLISVITSIHRSIANI